MKRRVDAMNEEADHFKEKWKVVLEKGDPFYNVNFSLDSSDYKFIGKIK